MAIIRFSLKSEADVERFVRLANAFTGDINVRSVHNHSVVVDGKSFISVLRLNLNDTLEANLISPDKQSICILADQIRQCFPLSEYAACGYPQTAI